MDLIADVMNCANRDRPSLLYYRCLEDSIRSELLLKPALLLIVWRLRPKRCKSKNNIFSPLCFKEALWNFCVVEV